MSDWVSVEKKTKKNLPKIFRSATKDEILSLLPKILEKYSFVVSGAVYGSVLSASFSESSDIDVMIFVKIPISPDDFREIKAEIKRVTNRNVDLVAMKICKKIQKPCLADEIFFSEVWGFGRTIFGENFSDFENISSKIGKF